MPDDLFDPILDDQELQLLQEVTEVWNEDLSDLDELKTVAEIVFKQDLDFEES
jgi:hypothetical protein